VTEGAACCAAFSASGRRWAVGLSSGSVLLVDVMEAEASTAMAAPPLVDVDDHGHGHAHGHGGAVGGGRSFGHEADDARSGRVQRTLLSLPPLSPPLHDGASAQPIPSPIVAMSFRCYQLTSDWLID